MNDHDSRIAALEAEVAALTLRDERRESEHRHLLKAYGEVSADREKLCRETGETVKLFSDYWDDRITGLAQRISTGGGGEVLAALLPELVKDTAEFVNRALDKQERRIMAFVITRVDQLLNLHRGLIDSQGSIIDNHAKAFDRIEALERLCGLWATR